MMFDNIVLFQSDLETTVVERLTATLKLTEVKGGKDVDKESNRINELIKVSGMFLISNYYLLLIL